MSPAAVTSTDLLSPLGASRGPDEAKLRSAAEDFEAIFLSQMLSTMTKEMGGLGGLSASEGGEDAFNEMYIHEIAKMVSRSGGVGVADAVLKELLKTQEVG